MYYDPTGHSAILIGLIIGAVIGAAIGFGTAAYIDYQDDGQVFNGSVEWYNYLGATVLGGIVGAGIGAGIGYIVPQIAGALSSFASSSFALGGGISISARGVATMSAGLTITGAQILQGAGILAGLGIMYMLPKQGGVPNSVVSENGSTGVYNENGNLVSRTDTTHSHFIKELGDYFRPHTHKYVWKFIKGAWRLVKKIVLPY